MEMPRGGWDMKIGSAARFQIEPRVNVVALCKQARNDVLKRCRAGGFLRMNFRDTEFTLSASSATISKTTRAVMSRSASIDQFELARSVCQIALPAPLRQCLASTSACVT